MVPLAIEGNAGVTSMLVSAAAVTVTVVFPLIGPMAAEITLDPTVSPLTNPCEPTAFETLALVGADDAHVAAVVMSCKVASLKKPIAANACVLPLAMEGKGGDTASDTRVASVTVRVTLPDTAPRVAEISVVPQSQPRWKSSPW